MPAVKQGKTILAGDIFSFFLNLKFGKYGFHIRVHLWAITRKTGKHSQPQLQPILQ